MITETLQGDGAFSISLIDDAPDEIASLLLSERYALVKIFRAHPPVSEVPNLLPLYTGWRLGSAKWGEVNGKHPVALLGAGLNPGQQPMDAGWKGLFHSIDKLSGPARLSDWCDALVGQGITIGAIRDDHVTGSLVTRIDASARATLDYVCAQLGAEYQVSTDLKLWAGSREDLYGPADTPLALFVAEDSAGYDARLVALAERDSTLTTSDIDRINRVITTSGNPVTGFWDTGLSTEPFKAPDGSQLDIALFDQNYSTDAEAIAARDTTLAAKSQQTREYKVTVAPFDIDQWNDGTAPTFRHLMPGMTIGVYKPAENVFDLANPTAYGGRTIFPVAVRCTGVQWPVRTGYGVYLDNRHNGGAVTDLTPYVAFEDGQDAQLTLGQLPKRLDGTRRTLAP